MSNLWEQLSKLLEGDVTPMPMSGKKVTVSVDERFFKKMAAADDAQTLGKMILNAYDVVGQHGGGVEVPGPDGMPVKVFFGTGE